MNPWSILVLVKENGFNTTADNYHFYIGTGNICPGAICATLTNKTVIDSMFTKRYLVQLCKFLVLRQSKTSFWVWRDKKYVKSFSHNSLSIVGSLRPIPQVLQIFFLIQNLHMDVTFEKKYKHKFVHRCVSWKVRKV